MTTQHVIFCAFPNVWEFSWNLTVLFVDTNDKDVKNCQKLKCRQSLTEINLAHGHSSFKILSEKLVTSKSTELSI